MVDRRLNTVRIENDVYEFVAERARERGVSIQEAVTKIIRDQLNLNGEVVTMNDQQSQIQEQQNPFSAGGYLNSFFNSILQLQWNVKEMEKKLDDISNRNENMQHDISTLYSMLPETYKQKRSESGSSRQKAKKTRSKKRGEKASNRDYFKCYNCGKFFEMKDVDEVDSDFFAKDGEVICPECGESTEKISIDEIYEFGESGESDRSDEEPFSELE